MRHALHALPWAFLLPFLFAQGFVFDFGDFVSFLDGLLADVIAALLSAIVYVWNTLVAVSNALASGLTFTWLGSATLFKDIGGFFKWVWNTVILQTIAWILKHLQDLKDWLKEHFKSLIDFLHRLEDLQRRFWKNVIRPIINLIIRLRQIIAILRIFHLHFLDKLDRFLGRLEGKIFGNFFLIRAWINRLLTYIEILLDAGGFLRRSVLLASLGRAADDILLTATGRGVDYWSGTEGASYDGPTDISDVTAEAADMDADLRTRSGLYWQAQEDARNTWADLRA